MGERHPDTSERPKASETKEFYTEEELPLMKRVRQGGARKATSSRHNLLRLDLSLPALT